MVKTVDGLLALVPVLECSSQLAGHLVFNENFGIPRSIGNGQNNPFHIVMRRGHYGSFYRAILCQPCVLNATITNNITKTTPTQTQGQTTNQQHTEPPTKKSRIRETKHFLTNADSSTNTKKILLVRQNSPKNNFFPCCNFTPFIRKSFQI